jgi:hypothetical protein
MGSDRPHLLRMIEPLSVLGKIFGVPMLVIGLILASGVAQEWVLWSVLCLVGQTTEATILQLKEQDSEGSIEHYFEYEYWVGERRYVERLE